MLDQVQAKIFQWLYGMLASQGIDGIFHGVGGEDFSIVALGVGGLKGAFETYRDCDLADIVAGLLLCDAQQGNKPTAVTVFCEANWDFGLLPRGGCFATESS